MKAIIILLICFTYQAKCILNTGDMFSDYWFLDNLEIRESDGDAHAIGEAGEIGRFQIISGNNGALAEWNRLHPEEQYLPIDLFNPDINKMIAVDYLDRSMEKYSNDEVKAVNSFNMGRKNTGRLRIKFRYLVSILGYTAVYNWLQDYYVISKTKDKRVWQLILKIDYNREVER